jgi:protein-tyrosine phosphatase
VATTVTSVEVSSEADGSLLVRWQLEGGPAPVDVAAGPTPRQVDHDHQATVPAGVTSLRLPGGPKRWYVSVAPHGGGSAVIAAERRVPFEGISNFRDLGGYRTRSGGSVRWGLVFRADALCGLSEADLAMYAELGLRAVFDLRRDTERQERPNPFPSLHLEMIGAESQAIPDLSSEDGESFLYSLYTGLVEQSAVQIGKLLTALAREGGLPAVFHCHAGKDRTGLVAAVLLEALGVERDSILDDYELTARYRLRKDQEATFQRLRDYGFSPEAAAGVLNTPRWAMQETLLDLERKYGDVDTYLTGPAKMRVGDLLALRRLLVVGGG